LIGPALTRVHEEYPDAPKVIQIAEAVSDLIGAMVGDVIEETNRRLIAHAPKSADDVRRANDRMVDFSKGMQEQLSGLRAFLHENMYRHHKVNRARSQAKRIVAALFELFMKEPEMLPPEWEARLSGATEARRARVICDYIAGMTDRYAMREYEKLFGLASMGPVL